MGRVERRAGEQAGDASRQLEKRLHTIQAAKNARFLEFHIPNWSTIATLPSRIQADLYSDATPLRKWGHDWWLKVEKASDGRVGLFLCCGESEAKRAGAPVVPTGLPSPSAGAMPLPTAATDAIAAPRPAASAAPCRWPVTVDYQLMAQRRNSDAAVCCSVKQRPSGVLNA